jgi:hypothetical protein
MAEPVIINSYGTEDVGAMIRVRDGWTLKLAPCDLTYLRVDHQARLQFGESEVVIGSRFVLQAGEVESFLDAEQRSALAPFLSLYPNTLTHASVDSQATLRLTFGSGATVTIPSDPQYEAWQVNGPGNSLVVCVPGNSGQLAIWE